MSDTIQTYITKMIDGNESREDIIHYQSQFKIFVKLPKQASIYETEGGWKQIIKPVIKPNSEIESLLKVARLKEEDFWKSLTQLKEATHTSVVSELCKNIIQESHLYKFPLDHYNTCEEKLSIMLNNKIKLKSLDDIKINSDNPDSIRKKLKEELINEVKDAFLAEYMHAIGGPELLGTVWNIKQTSGKTLVDSNPFEIAMFLQSNAGKIACPMKKEHHYIIQGKTVEKEVISEKKPDNPIPEKGKKKKFGSHVLIHNPNKKQVDAVEKTEDKRQNQNGCQICTKNGKLKAAATHSTKNHDESYVQRRTEEFQKNKKQKLEENQKK
jgi:hypothetical protein